MYCPQCGAEYRPGLTLCSDCQVALVADPPGVGSGAAGRNYGSPLDGEADSVDVEGGSFAMVWAGEDPRKHADVCDALEREHIPTRTVTRDDHLIYATAHPGFGVYVPRTLAAKAREALQAADAVEEGWEQLAESGALEIPAEDEAPDGDDGRRGGSGESDAGEWHSEDATTEVWSGADAELAKMIRTSLRENGIRCRAGSEDAEARTSAGTEKLFVLPEEEARAREIVRQIVEAAPPE